MMPIEQVIACLSIGLIGFILIVLAIGPAIVSWLEDKW